MKRKCEECGAEFEIGRKAPLTGGNVKRFCSREHQVAAYRRARAAVEKAARERRDKQRARLRGKW